MRISESMRLEEASGDCLVPPHTLQTAQLQQVSQECSNQGFEYFEGQKVCRLSGQTVLLPDHSHHKKKAFTYG